MRNPIHFMGLALLLAMPAFAQEQSMEIGEHQRTWILHLPPGSPKDRPLVFALHGGGGTAEGFDGATRGQLTREATRRRWGLVFPQGLEKGWNDGRPPASRRDERRARIDDVAFLAALRENLIKIHGFDASRVYFTGMSNGGFMSQRFALDRADQVAAIAPVVATVAEAWSDRRPTRPVPTLLLLGSEDPLVPYGGGQVKVFGSERGEVRSGPDSARHWAALNLCTTPTREILQDRDPQDETHVIVDRFACPPTTAVELWTLKGAGHTWPLGKQYLRPRLIGRVSHEVDGAGVIFDFFARFSR